jgi:glycosyltransferase involved in cell wall biosynthesis
MAHGLPCVSFDCDAGPADIIREGVDGFLVPTGDVAALADRLRALALDDARRAAFACRAREAAERFGPSVVLARWRRLVEEASAARA